MIVTGAKSLELQVCLEPLLVVRWRTLSHQYSICSKFAVARRSNVGIAATISLRHALGQRRR